MAGGGMPDAATRSDEDRAARVVLTDVQYCGTATCLQLPAPWAPLEAGFRRAERVGFERIAKRRRDQASLLRKLASNWSFACRP